MEFDVLLAVKSLVCVFFAVLFLQSGIDKVVDKKGNLGWLESHFASSPLRRFVGLMFAAITVMELATGVVSVVGVVGAFVPGLALFNQLGPVLASLAITMLFFGQRMAKDYAGAATLATYFCASILGSIICGVTKLP